jgi:hypothetical protein
MGLLLLAIWAILYGGNLATWWTISVTLLGVLLAITGVLLLLEGFGAVHVGIPSVRRHE